MIHLCSPEYCTGCAACAGACGNNAISFIENSEGFLYPHINYTKCVSCHLCEKTCPVLTPVETHSNGNCYAAWSLDQTIRTHSSSGGLFSEIALSVLMNNGIVIGACLDNSTGRVEHIAIDTPENLTKLQGSKYVQSTISAEVLKLVMRTLREGRQVLFTGTPCQIAGIISLTKNSDNLVTMDIVCHGVPSPKWFQELHTSIKNRIKGFVNYNFRLLSEWCVYPNVDVKIGKRIRTKGLNGMETCYQDAFLKGYLHRENCYKCKYANTKRVADITVADFWGIGTKRQITDEYKTGCSMLLINTTKGQRIFDAIKNRIYTEPRNVNETIDAGNEQLKQPSLRPNERNSFYADAYSITPSQLILKYNLNYNKKPSVLVRMAVKVKSVVKKLIK